MNIALISNCNFGKVKRKVLERDPILITQIHHPVIVNDEFCKRATGKTNSQCDASKILMSETQAQIRASEFERLIKRQQLAQNRSGYILERLQAMENFGYEGIIKETPAKIYNTLLKLDKKTIASFNDCQLFRICSSASNIQTIIDGLLSLEEEFSTEELLRLSQRPDSTIINTWINRQTISKESFENLTKYIHYISRR